MKNREKFEEMLGLLTLAELELSELIDSDFFEDVDGLGALDYLERAHCLLEYYK